jgi:hypothetical protein
MKYILITLALLFVLSLSAKIEYRHKKHHHKKGIANVPTVTSSSFSTHTSSTSSGPTPAGWEADVIDKEKHKESCIKDEREKDKWNR